MSALGINHITVLVQDKERAVKFYSDILGLEPFPIGKSMWMKVGSQFLHITEASGKTVSNSFYHFAIEVDDFKNFITGIINKGVDVFEMDKNLVKTKINSELDDPMRQFFVNDPDGNLVEIVDSQNSFFKKGLG
jgi:lactoylglutathione lyase